MSRHATLSLPGITAAPGSTAVFSPCGRYRYHLTREWGDAAQRCIFVMLNPSTADVENNDPTVRRCIGYAKDWGFGALDVLNLFALRSTDPQALYDAEDPIGPDNDVTIARVARGAKRVIAAWGNHGALHCRGDDVLALLGRIAGEVLCLGENKGDAGEPVHPLYQPKNLEPYPLMTEWAGAEAYVKRVLELEAAEMKLKPFRVWNPDDGDEPGKPNVHAVDEEVAAMNWVERHHADLDYVSDILVSVTDEEGHGFELRVLAEHSVDFRIGAMA